MATANRKAFQIVQQVKQVWGDSSIEKGGGSRDWLWRITSPKGNRNQLHASPSDSNWENVIWRWLKNEGFFEDKEKFEEADRKRKAEEAAERKRKNDLALAKAQKEMQAVARAAGPYGPQVADLKWLFAPHELPETRRILIPPELAQKILDEYNSDNRPLRKGRVAYWARVMRLGRWRYTHQGGAFTTKMVNGQKRAVLQDAQHRLAGAVEANYTLDMNFSVGMPPENNTVVDVGATRSGSDTMAGKGRPNYKTHSGVIRMVGIISKYGPEARSGLKIKLGNDEVDEIDDKIGDQVSEYVTTALALRSQKTAPNSSAIAVASAMYLIGKELPTNDVRYQEFWRGYIDGTNIPEGDIRVVLRSFMSNLKNSQNKVVPVVDQVAVFIKAWNMWVNGRTQGYLSFRKAELFPSVFVPEPMSEHGEDKIRSLLDK